MGGIKFGGKEFGIIVMLGVLALVFISASQSDAPFWSGWGTQQTSTITQTAGTSNAPPSETGDTPSGAFELDPQIVDHFVTTTTRTVGTDLVVTWYNTGSDYKYLGAGDTNIDIDKSAGGYIYAAVEGTATYYLDFDKTEADGSRIVAVDYFDIDDDDVKEFVLKISLWDVTRSSGYVPPVTLTFFSITYGAPSLVDLTTSTTSVGTSQVDQHVEWYTTQSTTNTGYALSKIEITLTSDSGAGTTYTASSIKSRLRAIKVDIPGLGKQDLGTSYQMRSSDILFTYKIGDDLFGAHYLLTSENDLNKQEFTTDITVDLNTSDPVFRLELFIYYIIPLASGEFREDSTSDIYYFSDTTA